MHDWLGIGLIGLGLGLIAAGIVKRRNRLRTPIPVGAIRPEFAAMGEMVRPLILFAVGFVAFKMSLFYFIFGGSRFLTVLDYGGLMFLMGAYCVYLIAATIRPGQVPEPASEPTPAPAWVPEESWVPKPVRVTAPETEAEQIAVSSAK